MAVTNFSYRPSVGALIVDSKKRFLLTELVNARKAELDFAKGGKEVGETEEEALKREMAEELGTNFTYEILEKSLWNVVYEWPQEIQDERGFLGQARVSYWVMFKSGDININPKELRAYHWIEEDDLAKSLKESGFPAFYVNSLLLEWEEVKKKHRSRFK